jgi:transposase
MSSYSMDLRVRVLKDSDAGMLTRRVAEKYQVSPAWVRRLKQRRRETAKSNRGRRFIDLRLRRFMPNRFVS